MDNVSGIPTFSQPRQRANTQVICPATTALSEAIDDRRLYVVLTGELDLTDDE